MNKTLYNPFNNNKMKTKLRIICIVTAALMLPAAGHSQEYKQDMGGKTKISIHSLFGELFIEGVSGSELAITAEDYEKPPPRADGLKPLYGSAEDNTDIGLSVREEGESLIITGATKKSQDATYFLRVPEATDITVDLSSPFANDIEITGMSGELVIESLNNDIKLINITGPAVIHSISGDIEGIFASINQENPTSITAVSGDIDLALPANGPANIEICTTTGEAYSDLDLKLEKEGEEDMMRIGGSTTKGILGAGGVTMNITSVSGNIFLRKQ
jgi:hypothetical protein